MVKIGNGISHWLSDAYAVFLSVGKPRLQAAKETLTARDCEDHTAQFGEGLVQLFQGDPSPPMEVSQDLKETEAAML